MTWTAPEVERQDAPVVADERAMYDGWLEFHRATLLGKWAGLGAADLRRRAAEPSSLSLLGLVRHMAEVERSWWQRRVAGRDIPLLYCDLDTNPDGDFDDVDQADPQADLAVFHEELEQARLVAAAAGLDDTFVSRQGRTISVRWVYVHMIEEYARHNGHADLLRERIDGRTGY
jgi:hypothetical protein